MSIQFHQHHTSASPASFSSIEELYTRYGRQAYALALKVLDDSKAAEEGVQEILLRYWRQPALYNSERGSFLNWLLREVHCYCLNNLPLGRDYSMNMPANSGPLSTEIINKKVAAPTIEDKAQHQKTRQVLAGLPQGQREIVELAYFKGMNHQQIAQATGQSAQSVRQSLATGLLTLKRGINKLDLV